MGGEEEDKRGGEGRKRRGEGRLGGRDQGGALDTPYIFCEGVQDGGLGGHQLVGGGK